MVKKYYWENWSEKTIHHAIERGTLLNNMATALGLDLPKCPICSSEEGCLGTECAYFVCDYCKKSVFWTSSGDEETFSWDELVQRSPWGRLQKIIDNKEFLRKKVTIRVYEGSVSQPHTRYS